MITVGRVSDVFDIQNLFPELVLGIGLALLVGNGLAWWKHRKGETPKGVEEAAYRSGRVRFLVVVGLLMTMWSVATVFS